MNDKIPNINDRSCETALKNVFLVCIYMSWITSLTIFYFIWLPTTHVKTYSIHECVFMFIETFHSFPDLVWYIVAIQVRIKLSIHKYIIDAFLPILPLLHSPSNPLRPNTLQSTTVVEHNNTLICKQPLAILIYTSISIIQRNQMYELSV